MFNDLTPNKNPRTAYGGDLQDVPEHIYQMGVTRMKHLDAYLKLQTPVKKDAEDLARKINLGLTQTYTLISQYREFGDLISVLPQKRTGGRGKSRLDPAVEKIIQESIDDVYMNETKRKVYKVTQEVRRRCRNEGRKAPVENTIRTRIKGRSKKSVMAAREGNLKATETYGLSKGHFPDQMWPLSTVQYDHTLMDIEIVDEETLKPIGRPWVTIGYDVKTKSVVGMHMSLTAPNSTAIGLVLVNTIFPKKDWLIKLGIETNWPMYGKPDVIHVDNGADFRSKAVERACANNSITLEYRPLSKKEFGGGVERSFRTLMEEIQALDGTTHSNVGKKGKYNSRGEAIHTFDDVERIVISFITKQYHERPHSGNPGKLPPRKMWEDGIYGNPSKNILGRGLPPIHNNPREILLQFLPQERRNVHRTGIVLDYIWYMDDILSIFLNYEKRRKFIIKRDPRDLSTIFIQDPSSGIYYDIPYKTMGRPKITLWEHKASLKLAQERLIEEINEDIIFEGIEEIRGIIENARERKKQFKRDEKAHAKTKWANRSLEITPIAHPQNEPSSVSANLDQEPGFDIDENETFDEIEIWE